MTNTTKKIIPVKACYGHIGGRLGNLLMEQFIENGWIQPVTGNDRLYYVTFQGKTAFTQMGIDLSLIPVELLEKESITGLNNYSKSSAPMESSSET